MPNRINKNAPVRRLSTAQDFGLFTSQWLGLNTFGLHSENKPGEFRSADNIDLYQGSFKSRRGADFLNITFAADVPVVNAVQWHLNGTDYVILALNTAPGVLNLQWSTISESGANTLIPSYIDGTTPCTLSSDDCELFISNNKCYVFSDDHNLIIEPPADAFSTFAWRAQGLPGIQPKFISFTSGALHGDYVYGLELVNIQDGADVLGSTPWRLNVDGDIFSVTAAGNTVHINAETASLPDPADGYFFNSVKIYRSLRLDVDDSDPANPYGPFGSESDLYLVDVMTYSDFVSLGYADNTVDSDLDTSTVWELDQIELEPIPPALLGTYHKDRIWVSGCGTIDVSESDVFYSYSSVGPYSEQYDPLNRVYVETGDGQKTKKLISLENDLIVIKEAKTGRIQNGNPDVPFQTLDHSIGISHKRLLTFITGLGLVGITNDQSDCKIFDVNSLQWTTLFGNQELARNVRSLTKEIADNPDYVDFIYVNGKLMINRGDGTALVLHAEQGLGWTTYSYPIPTSQYMTVFGGGRRACVITEGLPIYEIEVDDLETDRSDAGVVSAIACEWTMHRFQSNQGRDGLEFMSLDFSGILSDNIRCVPYMNGLLWPDPDNETATLTIPDPILYTGHDELTEGIYELFVESRPIGQFIHFDFSTVAPFQIRSVSFNGFVLQNMHLGFWNRMIATQNSLQTPSFLVPGGSIYDAGDSDRDISEYGIMDAAGLLIGDMRDITQYAIINRTTS